MARFPTSFAERNKIAVSVIGTLVLVTIFLLTFYAESLPVIGGGRVYTANFAESGGLRKGNEVRVAGVKVGKVTDVSLRRTTVVVRFRLKGAHVGDRSTAAVKVKTMLGQKYLSIDPIGSETLRGPIPVGRTTTPYDVNQALSNLSTTVTEIDTAQMEKGLEAITDAFENTPQSVRTTIRGLTDLSRTISTRDDDLAALLASTSQVTRTLADRNTEFDHLIDDGGDLLDELARRRDSVQAMLRGTAALGEQVRGLVKDNQAQLRPALTQLDRVSTILQANQDHLDAALRQLGPYYRVLTSAMGNGRWVDAYVCGLFDDDGAPVLDSEALRNCHPGKGQ